MTRRLNQAIARLRELPETLQDAAADALLLRLDEHIQQELDALRHADRDVDLGAIAQPYGIVAS